MGTERRPDPDELLARVKEAETRQARGKLKIFFGAAAGVGKTYAMLEAAREQRAQGVDVVVGWVETHGRAETEALLEGLEILPRRTVEYRGTALAELDLDGALARRPTLILVDELAHTNAPGSRHAKRWQDVLELLDAGINVYSAMNVQHVDSLNDVVAKITGVVVRETVPDSIFEHTDEVELIDLPPDDLLQRLRDGKIYIPEQAREAIENFFRKGNLIALRELALRVTAQHVDAEMRHYMRDHAIRQTWPVRERLLVCIGPSPSSIRLVRAAKRMAEGLGAEWIVAYVETPTQVRLPPEARDRVAQTMRLAEQLGALTHTLTGPRMSDEILAFARSRNVSKIVVGKPERPLWKRIAMGSIVDTLVQGSGEIDVYVISGDRDDSRPVPPRPWEAQTSWAPYAYGLVTVAICTGIAWAMFPYFAFSNLIMVYLLGVIVVATRYGRGPSLLASLLSVGAFDFFFVPPYFTFAVSDTQYFITFSVMLIVAVVISGLATRIRDQAVSARERERRMAALYAMSRELASTRGVQGLLAAAIRHITEVFRARVAVLLPDASGRLGGGAGGAEFPMDTSEVAVTQWVYEHGQVAGQGTDTLPGANGLYVPLLGSRGTVGVLGLRPNDPRSLQTPEQLHQLETFASQTALAIERARLAEEAEQAQVRAETERLRNSLLSSVSHDLRTPLASITGAASTLIENEARLDAATRRDLLEALHEEADRLNRLVQNLLEMTRLEAGALVPHTAWHSIEEVVGAALGHFGRSLAERPVNTRIPAELPLVPMDDVLIEQVLINLVDNAIKYTPAGTPIEVSAEESDGAAVIEVADRGPGLPPGEERLIFEKFHRTDRAPSARGAGLGLAICQGIIRAHGGRIWAENRPGGGVAIRLALPLKDVPPPLADPPTLAGPDGA
jgi:two-component system, OmpR family, sensor histidine kinase KdpD